MRRIGWFALAVTLGAGVLGGAASAGAEQPHAVATAWSLATSPLQAPLGDVSCVGANFCAAVGTLDQNVGSGLALWNGNTWTASSDPAASLLPSLRRVSCLSSSFCMAVGQRLNDATSSTNTLVEYWNGSSWSVLASPQGALANSELRSVSCTSTSFCLAVGSSTSLGSILTQTLSEVWNGALWSALPNPVGLGGALNLMSVSCASSSYCVSLGYGAGGGPLGVVASQLLWNGLSLSVPNLAAAAPPVGGLSCVSPTFCMAAANNTYSRWDGSSWSNLPVAASSEADSATALTCTSTTFCISAGSRDGHETGYITQTLVKEWNGTSWNYVPSANATTLGDNGLSGVSCTDTACTAVGTEADPDNGALGGLIESSALTSGQGATGPVSAPIVGLASTSDGLGYWLVGADGTIYNYGDAISYGSLRGTRLNQPIVGMAATPDGGGYWLVATDGGIFSFGDAMFYGSTGSLHLNKPVVGMASSPDGRGYWFVASDGGIFAFGDALFLGSMGGTPLNQPVVGMAVDNLTRGYWLVAADGGIFSFHAPFYGSTGALHLNRPIVGMEADPGGVGYRFVASDGGVFSFNLLFSGSAGATPLNQPVVGMGAAGVAGYWLAARDGGIFTFGGAPFAGSPA
jgi:hypothetical protein